MGIYDDEEQEEEEQNVVITAESPNVLIGLAHFGNDTLLEFAGYHLNESLDTLKDCRAIQYHLAAIRRLGIRIGRRLQVPNIEPTLRQGHRIRISPLYNNGEAMNHQDNPEN